MSLSRRVVVAIDGPAGAGKSTVARRLAEKLGFTYIDTGAMYRAVALWALRQGTDPTDLHRTEQLAEAAQIHLEQGGSRILLNGEDVTDAIRTQEVTAASSKVAANVGVRRALVAKQREMGSAGSVVMEGRDIGTVVFPDADIKVFLDAHPETRVDRRLSESGGRAHEARRQELAQEIQERDLRDSHRANSPLMQAPDAVYIDTTQLSLEQVIEEILRLIRARVSNGTSYA